MSKVRLLDKHTAELIAAGEVVERPSSVVKELVENCIDAGASVITVEIRHGGSSYIRVTDNGEGIAPDDVPTAFLRHATSKIRVGTDLDSIATLGFRGEALASICAVSKMELITRTADSDVGVHYVIEGSDEVVNEEIGCAVGTTIIVREMFFNTPARRKFLKSDKTEGNAIAAVIDRVALSHPEISFRFVREGKEVLLTPGDGKLRSAIHAVYGREFTLGLIPVKYSYNNVSVEGFVSKPVNSRPNRAMQIFFINGRYVRSNTMQRALEEACKGAVMIGKYPACVLGISLDCSAVDVNVHPAKLEVRFTEERPIYEAVYFAVKSSLAEFDAPRDVELPPVRRVNLSPNMHEYSGVQIDLNQSVRSEAIRSRTEQVLQNQGHHRPVQPSAAADAPLRVSDPGVSVPLRNAGFVPPPTYEDAVRAAEPEIHGTLPPEAPSQAREEGADEMLSDALANNGIPENSFAEKMEPVEVDQQTKADNTETIENTEPADSFILPAYRIVGEIFNTYILIESGGELILIDKHAAHERLIYERLLRQRDNPDSQLLLTPLPITLDKNQYDAVTGSIELLADAGFEVEDFGMGTVLLRSVPTILSGDDAEGAFLEIAGQLRAGQTSVTTEKIDWIYHTIACKSAVKGGDKNLPGELAELVLTLINNPDVRYCPHGRPIFVSLKQREIEKYFGRIQA
ncbi:MAG: DNA mismatch repair endonuclease MutL [Clostridia bacterium]|nr:DNA mismatch repair endonuclease MutL [Clostridia bacterium]